MSTQIAASNELYLAQARACLNVEDCESIYDKWASTYNAEVGDSAQNYVAPTLVAHVALHQASKINPSGKSSVILDAGCGTGLVGQAIAVTGAKHLIDGLDISPAMLDVAAKTGAYRSLAQADLTRRIPDVLDETYDIVTCVGTFTLGHVGPEPALREFIRITRRKGIVVATILEQIWVSGRFKTEVEKLKEEKLVTVVSEELIDYVKGHGDKAVLLVLEKTDRGLKQ
ncbi:MAG: hypothetical protein M1835_002066 [Candelina submexicana]|nr:MAG: hypothetical protein M1835_002066 [Candelina submexicana]